MRAGGSARTVAVSLLAFALGLLLLLPGLGGGPLQHGDEGRFAVAAREVLRGGSWLVPTVLGEPVIAKPPLYTWLVAGAGALRGRLDEAAARLPGALAAAGAAAALAALGARLGGPGVGLAAGLMFLSAFGPFLLAREVLPDMPMTGATVLAMLAAVMAWQQGARWAPAGFGAALALGFHFKLAAGVVPPVVTALLVAAVRRSAAALRALRPPVALACFVVLLLPWLVRFVLIEGFLLEVDAETLSGRAWTSAAAAAQSVERALASFAEQAFPWTLFLPGALVHVWRRRATLRDDPLLVPLVWLGVTLAMAALVNMVRWRYLLPAMPPAMLLVALAWEAEAAGSTGRPERWLLRLPLAGLLGGAVLAGFSALAGLLPAALGGAELGRALREPPWVALPLAWLVGGGIGLACFRRRVRVAMLAGIALAGASLGGLDYLTREERSRDLDPRPFAAEVRRLSAGRPILFNGGSSLTAHLHFHADTPTREIPLSEVAARLREGRWELLLLSSDALADLSRAGLPGADAQRLAEGRFGRHHLLLLGRGPGGGAPR
jgi:4-amino-4-deoxy-L-arabinose transferase-like glycosyltransferase